MKHSSRVLLLITASVLISSPALAKKKKNQDGVESPITESVRPSSVSKNLQFSVSLGYVYNTYQSQFASGGQHSVMAKVSAIARSESFERWSLGFSGFSTVLPLSTIRYVSGAGVAEATSIYFLGLNLRVGYDTTWLPSPWSLQLATGWYVNTTFVKNNRFGYEWVNGPQLYPQWSYRLDEQRSIGGYLKFSPVMAGPSSVLSLTRNFEAATGLNYLFPASWLGNRTASIAVDFAHLSLQPDALKVFSNSTSFNLGLQF